MRKKKSSNSGYLFLLVASLIIGSIIGGELVRRIYSPDTSFLNLFLPSPKNDNKITVVNSSIPTSRNSAIVTATKMVESSVVGIVVTHLEIVGTSNRNHDYFTNFFGPRFIPRYKEVENMGSGFVIDERGIILTNNHVVEGAKKLYINFSDGRQFEGKIVGQDPFSDIAVVSVIKDNVHFNAVKFGKSKDAMIGEWVIAIGNPFLNFFNDAQPTVTVGVVSALNRNFAPTKNVFYQNMIQTDAAINPGNSGGPLVNALGEVIGINAFIYTGGSKNSGSIGIGFAIPSDLSRKVAEELIKFGRRRAVWTGIAVKDLDRAIALTLGLTRTTGVVVTRLYKKSPGYKAGLKENDIIIKMAKKQINSHVDLDGLFLSYFPGDKVDVEVIRSGRKIILTMLLDEYRR